MENMLILATRNGVVVCERTQDGWVESLHGLSGHSITAVAARDEIVVAGTPGGIYISEDFGYQWKAANSGLTSHHVRWLTNHPDAKGLIFAGVEPAGIFISYEGGLAWRSCPEVAHLRERHNWQLPYSPQAGCVRGFAFQGLRGYAAVEDGAVLVSDDSGESWHLAEGSRGDPDHSPAEGRIHSDVHSIEAHPSSKDLVFAPTGGGLYRSKDGGRTWELLYACYTRAVWVDPDDSEHLIFGPADGVDRMGRIESSRDGGQSWMPANGDLPVPWTATMVERFTQINDELLAVLSNGELYAASISTLEWRQILPDVPGIAAVTSMTVE
jgi:hypothetical protein